MFSRCSVSGVSIKEMFCGLCLVGVLPELLSFGSAAVSSFKQYFVCV